MGGAGTLATSSHLSGFANRLPLALTTPGLIGYLCLNYCYPEALPSR